MGCAAEDCAGKVGVLFLITASTQMTAPATTNVISTGDAFFLATVGRGSGLIEGNCCGLPQCGQLAALGEISLPQSGHFISGIASAACGYIGKAHWN
jgi:hypothetical protein